jgi:parvulin-like peptidyl-prolyl isomerase
MTTARKLFQADSARPRHARRNVLIVGAMVIGVALAARWWWGAAEADADNPPARKPARAAADAPAGEAAATPEQPATPQPPQVAAVVNGEEISRQELIQQCVRLFGTDTLETLVNKQIIGQECKQRGITITKGDVQKEVDRLAERFGMSTDRWLSMLEQERGIAPDQYLADIVWPTLALRAVAAAKLEPTDEELQEAYEAKYGPAVQVRLIACNRRDKAEEVHAQAVEDPSKFGRLAKEHSDDPNSASQGGAVLPVRRHTGDPALIEAAFALEPGQVSEIVPVGSQFVFLLCEKQLPPLPVTLAKASEELRQEVRDRKERRAAAEVFQQLQERAAVENVINDPVKSRQYPGVAAIVNGKKITLGKLGEECLNRDGADVLEGMIVRKLIEQACTEAQIEVTDEDLDAEIFRAARAAGVEGEDEQQVMDRWMAMVTEEQGLSIDSYVHDVVWPSVALKHLVGDAVEVSDEDLQKGFDANYGRRARCLAIVLGSQRRAQEVWELARDNPTADSFGDLAEQYSVDAASAQLRGEIPPIQMHGGQPLLEEAAFSLEPGELSGIIQVDDKFVILRLQGFTKPVSVEFEDVRDYIFEDLHEKKLRLAMARKLDELQEIAQIDNYLAGTVQEGVRPASAEERPRRRGSQSTDRTATPGGATRR